LLHGRIHQRRFRAAEAIAEYAEAARLDSTSAEPHRELGLLYVELKRPDQARAALRRYLALAPDAPDAAAVERKLTELAEP
jgi:regulator of sirC expression with transglutaminase-like and TPR domain